MTYGDRPISEPGLQIGWPICPQCHTGLQDPAVGTDVQDTYALACECGAWTEFNRHVRVGFSVKRWSPSVPPWVYGIEENVRAPVAPPASSGVLPPYAEPADEITRAEGKNPPRRSKKFPPRG
jgi:hypothetical protein